MATATLGRATGSEEPGEIVRIGNDPFGRNERTVYYRQPKTHGAGVFYVWAKMWPAHWPALPDTQGLTDAENQPKKPAR